MSPVTLHHTTTTAHRTLHNIVCCIYMKVTHGIFDLMKQLPAF